mgnify:CR=1 FL=1
MAASKRFLLVGSLLRPESLQKYNREIENRDDITYPFYDDLEGYQEVEDQAVRQIVQQQLVAGLPEISDGEFSRSIWHLDFFWGMEGVDRYIADQGWLFQEKTEDSCEQSHFETRRDIGLRVTGPVHSKNHEFIKHYKRVKDLAPADVDVKLTIPAPAQIYSELSAQFSAGGDYSHDVYETPKALREGLVAAWKEFIDEFVAADGEILQMDDCTWTKFSEDNPHGLYSDEDITEEEIKETAQHYVEINNQVIDYAHKKGLKVYTHNCRGNYASRGFTGGSYENIAQYFLANQNYDRFYLEWDDTRAGNISALSAFKDKSETEVVVGFLSSKLSNLDDEEEVLEELEEAAKYVAKDNLYLSHQCGFASCDGGNELTQDQQWDKIKQGQEIARKFWGE